jgi:hypothetical protein
MATSSGASSGAAACRGASFGGCATSGGGDGTGLQRDDAGVPGPPAAAGHLSSWLVPFRKLSVAHGAHHPPPAAAAGLPRQMPKLPQWPPLAGCHLLRSPQRGQAPQPQPQLPLSPEITREKLERLRAKALLVAAGHPDLEEGACSPKAGRRTSADQAGAAHNCGEGWQIAAWRGARRDGFAGATAAAAAAVAAAAAAAAAAARRHSSHI